MPKLIIVAALVVIFAGGLPAQAPPALSPAVRTFVSVDAPVVALTHVRVIDGTGAPPAEDQTIVIAGGRVQAIGAAAGTTPPAGAKVMDLRGYTVIPGLVGMHDHLFYPSGGGTFIYNEMGYATLLGVRRNYDPHDRQHRALYGPESEKAD